MKLTGKEYRRRLSPVIVKVSSLQLSWMKVGGPRVRAIWEKRRCFVCHGKFTEGESVGIAMTDKGSKLLCSGCATKAHKDWDKEGESKANGKEKTDIQV